MAAYVFHVADNPPPAASCWRFRVGGLAFLGAGAVVFAGSAFQALGIRVERICFQALGVPVGGSASLGTWVPCPGSTWVPPVSHLCSPCVLLWLSGPSCTPTHRNGKVQREVQFWDPQTTNCFGVSF